MNKRELGKYGEEKAVEFLKKKGYSIIERNYRYRRGEIDIIALDQDYLVFIEVKLRRSLAYGSPQAAVDYRKQEKIKYIAQYYLLKNNICLDDRARSTNIRMKKLRFDVISIQIKDGRGYLKHFKNAF